VSSETDQIDPRATAGRSRVHLVWRSDPDQQPPASLNITNDLTQFAPRLALRIAWASAQSSAAAVTFYEAEARAAG
jgi:hypothetical protein